MTIFITLKFWKVMRGPQPVPACIGEEGLIHLLKMAHERYLKEVTAGIKSYLHYATDFVNSTKYHDATDAWSKNEHHKNHHILYELLVYHEIMVRKVFDSDNVDEQALRNLLQAFYKYDLPINVGSDGADTEVLSRRHSDQDPKPHFRLKGETVGLIARLVNELGLSVDTLDPEEVVKAYERHELKPVVSAGNVPLALVLDRLAMHDIIPYNWKAVIEREKIVKSSTKNKFLKAHNLAATLSRSKDNLNISNYDNLISTVDRYITLIKENIETKPTKTSKKQGKC